MMVLSLRTVRQITGRFNWSQTGRGRRYPRSSWNISAGTSLVVPCTLALTGKPIPKVAQLSQEYAALLAEKQEQYAEYKELRQDMIDYRTMKQNVDKILGLVPEEQEQNRDQKPER